MVSCLLLVAGLLAACGGSDEATEAGTVGGPSAAQLEREAERADEEARERQAEERRQEGQRERRAEEEREEEAEDQRRQEEAERAERERREAERTEREAEEEAEEATASCHPSYEGACLDPSAVDYDCAGGSGDGPEYTGTVYVVGPDEYGLDRDGDGVACE